MKEVHVAFIVGAFIAWVLFLTVYGVVMGVVSL